MNVSRFIQVPAVILFQQHCVTIWISTFSCLSVDGCFECLSLFSIINNTMNIVFKFCCDYSKRMSKNIFNNFEYITRHVLARKYGDCILNFWRADKCFTNGHFICSLLARNNDLHGLPSFLFMFTNIFIKN